MKSAGWRCRTSGDQMHAWPVDDLIEHDLDGDDCVCGVLVDPVEREDGSIGWVLVHHALDGRE